MFSPKVLARIVFADPELTLALPAHVTAATGMDALTHNIESYLSPAYHPLCDGIALEGTRIAARSLVTAVQEPGNLQARSDMMMASMMGAIAFQKDLGAVHSCAHALGAVCDLHHGLANALMIDTVLAWNYEAVPEKFDELAHVCKVSGGGEEFVPWLRALKARVGITGKLAEHGVKREQIPRLVEIAVADICHQTNPRPCTAADFRRLFEKRCDGAPTLLRSLHPGGPQCPSGGGRALAMNSAARLKIGISACFMHADPARPLFTGKTLQYVEQSIAHWVMSTGALAVMIPSPTGATQRGDVTLDHYAQWLDGLVLHGGADVSPLSYGEQPLQEKWVGDKIRDEYEIDLVAAFERQRQAGVRRLPRTAAAQCGVRRHAVPGHPDPVAAGPAASRRLGVRPQLPYGRNQAGFAAGGSCTPMPAGSRSTASITRPSRTWRPASRSKRSATTTD